MDVFSASDKQYLPQTVISVVSKNGLNFESTASSTPIVEFALPGTLGFINAEDTVLNFEFSYKVPTGTEVQNVRPQASTGLAGMIRQIDITAMDGTVLEQILDYDVLQGVLYSHDNGADKQVQDGEFNMRQLTEAYCRDDENPTGFVNPSVTPSLTNNGNNITAVDGEVHEFQTQKILLPIRLSALIGAGGRSNNRIIPLSSIGGLNIRFLLNPCSHFSILHSNDIQEDTKLGDYFYATPLGNDPNAKLIKIQEGFNDIVCDGTVPGNTLAILTPGIYSTNELDTLIAALPNTLTGAVNVGFTQYSVTNGGATLFTPGPSANFFINFCKIPAPGTIAAGATAACPLCTQSAGDTTNALGNLPFTKIPIKWKSPYNGNPFDLNSQPFLTGTTVQMKTQGLSPNQFINAGSKIKSIKADALTAVFNRRATFASAGVYPTGLPTQVQEANIQLELTSAFDPTTAIPAGGFIADGDTIKTVVNEEVQYTMNNVSMDVTVVTPPPAYISAMMSAIQSGDGMDFSMNVFETLRTNVLNGEAVVQMNLPYVNTRARSILSVPTAPGSTSLSTFTNCNLLRPLHLTKYFYTYSGVRHPSLGVDTTRVQSGLDASPERPSLSQELLSSQKDSFEYSLDKLRSFDAYRDGYKKKVFFVGRPLGTLNSTFNVQNQNLSLTIEATSGTAISQTMTVNHYLYSENIIKITPSGVTLFR